MPEYVPVADRDQKPEYAPEIPVGDRDVLKSASTEIGAFLAHTEESLLRGQRDRSSDLPGRAGAVNDRGVGHAGPGTSGGVWQSGYRVAPRLEPIRKPLKMSF